MILVIDNYDSFVYNLARYLHELGVVAQVVRNDQITIEEIGSLKPSAIVISPGPCTPQEAGISMDVVAKLGSSIPILGVCLGHQAIAAALGGQVVRANLPVHGKSSLILHEGDSLFDGIPSPFRAARYHSLLVAEETLPPFLRVIARTTEGLPMALAHRDWPLYGVQFHPESILTEGGHRILHNFLRIAGCPSVVPEDIELYSRPTQLNQTATVPPDRLTAFW